MPDKIVNHFVLADGSTAKYDAGSLLNLDGTVSLAGSAPDAKAVGDRLIDVEDTAYSLLPTGHVTGQYINEAGEHSSANFEYYVYSIPKNCTKIKFKTM